jgi:hypothetical protein
MACMRSLLSKKRWCQPPHGILMVWCRRVGWSFYSGLVQQPCLPGPNSRAGLMLRPHPLPGNHVFRLSPNHHLPFYYPMRGWNARCPHRLQKEHRSTRRSKTKDGRGSSPSAATVLSRVGEDPSATEELADVAPPHAILLPSSQTPWIASSSGLATSSNALVDQPWASTRSWLSAE